MASTMVPPRGAGGLYDFDPLGEIVPDEFSELLRGRGPDIGAERGEVRAMNSLMLRANGRNHTEERADVSFTAV